MASNPDTADKFAFPKSDCDQLHAQTGMTLRDYFAAQAITGIITGRRPDSWSSTEKATVVFTAYSIADAMLKERNK